MRVGEALLDCRLRSLLEAADECLVVPGGYRLRFARGSTMLQVVAGAIESNPALRFQMTSDVTGTCWLDVRTPRESARPVPSARVARPPVVA